jgi:FAD/FMN-containing dehydrogenase
MKPTANKPSGVAMSNQQETLDAAGLRATFGGEVVTPDDQGYDDARAVWNGMVTTRPALIARCQTVGDIAAAVNFARATGISPAVRAGGHRVGGLSSSDGMVIDLSPMRGVRVDAERRVAVVEPGATWADFDAATAAHGLASTGGLISSTGVAGLTLGGGIGWLQRAYGLACDNLVGADVVTSSGEVVRADDANRPDLMWGLRGGGGNFGIVSSFEFALHPVSTVLGGLMLFGWDRAGEVLATFREWAAEMPDEGTMLAAVMTAPPEPFVPEHLVGRPVLGIVGCWCGDPDAGQAALGALRELKPEVDLFGPIPYPALQGMLNGGAPSGARNYFRAGYADGLPDAMIDVLVEHGSRLPSPMSAIHIHQMGGAVGRVAPDATAFGNRGAAFAYNLVSTWTDAGEDAQHIDANRALAAALEPWSTGGAYVNFLGEEGVARIRAAYGDSTYERLALLKRTYDPENLFCRNQNIPPAS